MNRIINITRRWLILTGKMLPFLLCFVVLISYAETFVNVAVDNYIDYYGATIPNNRISFFIASYFEYDALFVILLAIISFALNTCKWNKLAILYLFLQLQEKHFAFSFELTETEIYAISLVNVLLCGFLCVKGITLSR